MSDWKLFDEGYAQGKDQGYLTGYDEGHKAGWKAAKIASHARIEELEQQLQSLQRRYETRKIMTHAIMYGVSFSRFSVDAEGNISAVLV